VLSGLFEALGKVGVTFVEVLRNQPLALVLLVINLALLTTLYIGESNRIASRERALDVILEQQNRIQERLAHCLNADDILKLLLRGEGQKTPP
jgi:sensor domain CHASE-containing protein